jgi:hypothetical protein
VVSRIVIALLFVSAASAYSQSPVTLSLGAGGGFSMPTGSLADDANTGYHAGAKARLGGILPLNFTAGAKYNSLPLKAVDESATQTMFSGGVEFGFPSAGIHPYLGAEYIHTSFDAVAGESAYSRAGIGFNAGMEFDLPALGSFDTAIGYHLINSFGADDGEATVTQLTVSVWIMFSLL